MSRATDAHIASLKAELDRAHARVDHLEKINHDLIVQIQANTQGYAHVPIVTPEPVNPDIPTGYLTDDTGLVQVPIYAGDENAHLPDLDGAYS